MTGDLQALAGQRALTHLVLDDCAAVRGDLESVAQPGLASLSLNK